MQAIGRRCGRPGLFTVRQGRNHIPLTPFRAFSSDDVIHQDKPPQKPQNDIPPIPDENYRNVPVDPETKTVKTAVGDLPISPLMDPTFHEARSKFTKPKPVRTEHKPTKFQRHLRRNPYGMLSGHDLGLRRSDVCDSPCSRHAGTAMRHNQHRPAQILPPAL